MMQSSSQSLASSKKIEVLSKYTSSDLSQIIVQNNKDKSKEKQVSIVNMNVKPPVRLEKISE